MKRKLVIIGSGPSGLVCALNAFKAGVKANDMLIIEREDELGGTLNLCIHPGFGKNDLTGTELASELSSLIKKNNIPYLLGTTVISIAEDKTITAVSPTLGYVKIKTQAIVLATGCREKSRGGLSIGGTRPAGIVSAGTAQRFVNIEGYLPGKKTVIIGSTDIALIVARRLSLEGGRVLFVCDTRAKPQAKTADISECLEYFGTELRLRTTVTRIYGKERVEAIEIADLDKKGKIIKGTKKKIECDSLVYSCGFLPETELMQEIGIEIKRLTHGPRTDKRLETSVEGVFACGNARIVHDDVEDVMADGKRAGKGAADYLWYLNKRDRIREEGR